MKSTGAGALGFLRSSIETSCGSRFPLRKLLEQFEAMRVSQRFCDGSELGEQRQFRIAD